MSIVTLDEIATQPANRLYEQDFYAWTQAQAELLRSGRLDKADVANILEEIESLGRTQLAELRSRLKVLAHHLLKEIYQPEKASRSWVTTIVVQRDDISVHMQENPSLKPKLRELFDQAYASARKVAAAETNIPLKDFPKKPPFTFAQALDEAYWPGRPANDRN